jgi:hypothetical protein
MFVISLITALIAYDFSNKRKDLIKRPLQFSICIFGLSLLLFQLLIKALNNFGLYPD